MPPRSPLIPGMLAGTLREQRIFLNALRYVANDRDAWIMNMSVVFEIRIE
jgi:hypothetical protein